VSHPIGTAALDRVRHIRLGEILVAVRGFDWEVERFDWTQTWSHQIGAGLATLLLRTLDGKIERAISESEVVAWELDADGEVRLRLEGGISGNPGWLHTCAMRKV
jgi:hypothetical protein